MKCWATPAATRIAIQSGFIQRPHAVSSISAASAARTTTNEPAKTTARPGPVARRSRSRQSARLPTTASQRASASATVRGERGRRRKSGRREPARATPPPRTDGGGSVNSVGLDVVRDDLPAAVLELRQARGVAAEVLGRREVRLRAADHVGREAQLVL